MIQLLINIFIHTVMFVFNIGLIWHFIVCLYSPKLKILHDMIAFTANCIKENGLSFMVRIVCNTTIKLSSPLNLC